MNIFTHIISYFKHGDRTSIDPMRDWLVLLACTLIILVGIVVWNVWAFDTITRGGAIGSTATNTASIVDRSSLDTIHTVFQQRASEEAKYKTGVYRFSDTSQ